MADIDLQKKRRGWVPWVLGILVALLAIWGIAELADNDEPVAGDLERQDLPAVIEPAPAPGPAAELAPGSEDAAIADYRQRCVDTTADEQDMNLQHDWTVRCLESLAAAMDATIRVDTIGEVVLQERLATLRERASDVRDAEPGATTHAATVAEAFDAGAELVDVYQQERASAGADYAASVRDAADRLAGNQPLLEQSDAVHAYFREMATALQTMSAR